MTDPAPQVQTTVHTHQSTDCQHDGLHVVHAVDDISIAVRIKDAENICKQQGVKLTPLRAEVLQLILAASNAVGAYDLMALMKHTTRPVAPPTVYRSLEFLLAHGLIHRLASINAYIPCCHPRAGHTAMFLICERCQRVSESSDPTLITAIQALTQQAQFCANTTTLEIAGVCIACQTVQP